MGTRRYDLTREPRDDAYRELVAAAVEFCDRAVLVVPPREADSCETTLSRLREFVLFSFNASQWPGTVSWDDPAAVYWLNLTPECAVRLGDGASGLYDWQTSEGRPEDLSLLCQDGREFLVSVAHEGEAWMWLTDAERRELGERLPQLHKFLRG